MKKIKVFWNLNELAHWNDVFSQQWDCMVKSGLMDAADEIILMGNGRKTTFTPIIDANPQYPNLCFTSVCDSAALHEYPALMFMHSMAKEAEEPFHILYIHMKGLTRWGNPNVEDWKFWLNWAVIERWQDNVAALQTNDVSGPNWDIEPWPHFSGNFWCANSNYVAKLDPLIHPHKLISLNVTKFKFNGHWRFDCEAWIGSGNPLVYEIARSFDQGDRHYFQPYPRELYRDD
jgi:hypothetical protein